MPAPIAAFSPVVRLGDWSLGAGTEDELALGSTSVGRASTGKSDRSLGFHATVIASTAAVPGPTTPLVIPRPKSTSHTEAEVV